MPQNDIDYRLIRRKAEERVQQNKIRMRRVLFAVYTFLFVLFMAIGWGLYLSHAPFPPFANHDDPVTGAMILLSTVAFLGVLFQMIAMVADTKSGERQMREQAYGQALSEYMMQLGEEFDDLHEKPKHMTRLTDDGELEEVPIDEAAYAELDDKARRRSS